MQRGNAVAICYVAGCVLALLVGGAHADTITIGRPSPNPVQQGQTLLVPLGVGYDSSGPKAGACPLTLTPSGSGAPLVTKLVSAPPDTYMMAIPDDAKPGTYVLKWTCSNGLSATPVTVSIIAEPPPQVTQLGLLQPSGSDQAIQGVGFSNTQGRINFTNSQGTFEPLAVTSWSDTAIQYTLPIVPPGAYQMTVVRRYNGGSSQPQTVQITPTVLQGWVDLHTHPVANLASGGKVFYGNVDFDAINGVANGSSPGYVCAPIQPLVNSIPAAIGPEEWVHGPQTNITPYSAIGPHSSSVLGPAASPNNPSGTYPYNPCGDGQYFDIHPLPGVTETKKSVSVRDSVIHITQNGNNAADWDDSTYTISGYPDFPTWPTWDDITHQKMWVDWIQRAFNGGLRVMVALAVNSRTLGDLTVAAPTIAPWTTPLSTGDLPTDDMTTADNQIQEIKNFVSRHSTWMQVAYSSTDIYNIVSSTPPKLAVVIGVEINNIGNLGSATNSNRTFVPATGYWTSDPAQAAFLNGTSLLGNLVPYQLNTGAIIPPVLASDVINEVDRLYDVEGVRYIFPIHLADNPIGGTAVYTDEFNLANVYEEGDQWKLRCSIPADNIKYTYKSTPTPVIADPATDPTATTAIGEWLKLGFVVQQPSGISCPASGKVGNNIFPIGNVNTRPLTAVGLAAIQEMMNKGMLIDIDHMSDAAATQAISLAQTQPCKVLNAGCVPTGYPLNSGHNAVRGVSPATAGTERNLTKQHYEQIGQLHGMAGVGSVNLDACTWMNEYNAVVSAMGTNESSSGVTGPEVIAGFGTDWFLAAGMPPRLQINSTTYSQDYRNCIADCNAKRGACSAEPLVVAACRACTGACATKYPGTTKVAGPTCNGQLALSNVQYNAAFPKSSFGNQSWDYNTEGVAHYGMLPDFLQDIQSLPGAPAGSTGVTGEILTNGTPSGAAVVSQMNSGAQYFYQTWRNAENVAAALKAAAPSGCTPNCVGKCGGVSDGCGGTCTVACRSGCVSSCGTVTDTKCGASDGCGGTCKGYCAPTGAHEICTGSSTAGYRCQATGP